MTMITISCIHGGHPSSSMKMLGEILIFILTTLTVYFIYAHRRLCYKFNNQGLKYNPGWPIFGNVLCSTFLRKHVVEDIDAIYKEFPDERYVGFIDGMMPAILIRDPDIIKNITVKDFDHFINHKDFFPVEVEPLFGSSLLMLKDEKWRDMRTTLSPAFTGSKMRHMMPFMSEISMNIIQHLKGRVLEDIDVCDLMRRYTNDVIASSAFGLQVNSVQDKDNDFYKIGQSLFALSPWQRLKFFIAIQFPEFAKFLGITIFSAKYSGFFDNLVATTMKHRENNKIERPDMIQLLMQAYKGNLKADEEHRTDDGIIEEKKLKRQCEIKRWSQRDLASQLFIFFLAGFETSATALILCVHELTVNSNVQEKLYREIESFNKKYGTITYDNINDLKYLDCVLNETMRKWSPALIMDRVCTKDYELPSPHEGGKPCKLKPGDLVYNVVNSLHLDPKYYPEPEKFIPERFAEEKKNDIKPFTFMPFGMGPRNCIGSRFALLELKVLIYNLISNFKLLKCQKTTDPIKLQPHDFNIRALGGTWIRFENRN